MASWDILAPGEVRRRLDERYIAAIVADLEESIPEIRAALDSGQPLDRRVELRAQGLRQAMLILCDALAALDSER